MKITEKRTGILAAFLLAHAASGQAWINEIHYDNAGGDTGEFIEVIVEGAFNSNLSDITVTLYNGSNGAEYDSYTLDLFTTGSVIPDVGTIYSLAIPGIQNGGPDGVALDYNGNLIQFLSYEGTMTATDGPASGVESTDIDVEQTSTTPEGSSLGLTGNGTQYLQFLWSTLDGSATPGAANTGQTFGDFIEPPASVSADAIDTTSVSISFTTNGSDEVLILFNSTGEFGTPVGAAPSVGNAFAGGEVLYKGTASPQTQSSLIQGETIYYAFYSVTTGDEYSNTALYDFAIPGRAKINFENFESETSDWINQTVSGTGEGWSTDGGDAYISGFGDSTDENHYLVSPILDLTEVQDLQLSFDYQERYNGENPEILYSTNYSGSGDPEATATWTVLPFTFNDFSDGGTTSEVSQGEIDLPETLEGASNVYLAFKYTSDGTSDGSETWILDNLLLTASTTPLGIDPEPSSQPTSFMASADGSDTVELSWTDSNDASRYLILVNETGSFTDPVDGSLIADDTVLSDGSAALNVEQGTESATFSGLNSNTTYFFKIFAYSNSGINADYLLTGAPTASATTDLPDPEPSSQPTGLTATPDLRDILLSWSDPVSGDLPSGYLVFLSETDSFTDPIDGVAQEDDTDFSDGNGVVNVPYGAEGYLFALLDASTEYFFRIYPYSNSGLNIDYLTTDPASTSATTEAAIRGLLISQYVETESASFPKGIEIWNNTGVVIDFTETPLVINRGTNGGALSEAFTLDTGFLGVSEVIVIGSDDTGDPLAEYMSANFPDVPYFTDGSFNHNGNDAFQVLLNGIVQDTFGNPGEDPGSAWSGNGVSTANQNIELLESVTEGDVDGWTDPSVRFQTVSVSPSSGGAELAGFGVGPDGGPVSVDAPTDVVATAVSGTANTVSFTTNGTDDVIIVFNTTGSFTPPSGATPAEGEAFAGGTILYKGSSSPQSHTGLIQGETVYYAVFSYNSDPTYSDLVEISATPGLIAMEDFEGASPTWVNQSVAGDDPWQYSNIGGSTTANLDGGFGEDPDNHYLVSPAYDFTGLTGITISFDYGEAYESNPLGFELVYSTNYSGSGDPEASGVVWTPIAFTFEQNSSSAGTFSSFTSGDVELPAILEGQSTVYLAFHYSADGTLENSKTWYVDNIGLTFAGTASGSELDTWLSGYGLSLANLSDDDDNDGLAVILEYLGDLDPDSPDSLELTADVMNGDQLIVQYTSTRADEPEGISVELLGSDDLGITDPFAPISFDYAEPISLGEGLYLHQYYQIDGVSDPVLIGDPEFKPFLQLRVTSDE